ncbi:DUF4915 domain-containing protein [Lentzea chajnantorensis]
MSLTTDRKSTAELIGLDGLLPDGHRLLASCFDAHHTIGGGLFAIGEAVEEIDRISSSGLCAGEGLLYRCLWSADGSPAELVVYDETGVRRYHRLDNVSTPHDILVVDGNVLVAATMQNEVQCVGPDGEVAWRWQAPGEADSWHLNSLARYGDRTVVCGFGEFLRRHGWDENGKPASGRVVDLETGEPVLEGLKAPHNPYYADGTWLVCDSATGDLVEIDDTDRTQQRRLALPGWPRGLVAAGHHLFVGLSPHRHAATSVETAAVAVVDRANWSVLGVVNLPAREVYALALAPAALVEGARQGFGANQTRVHEQGQWQMFDRLGVRPRRLWAVGDPLAEDECHASITLDGPVVDDAEAGGLLTLDCLVRNTGAGVLTPAPPFPVRVVHRWTAADGSEVPTQPIRSALPQSLPPEAVTRVPVRTRVPDLPGLYKLHVTLAQDNGVPFDQLDQDSALVLDVSVVSGHPDYEALSGFGLYPNEVRTACNSGGTVSDVVRTLLSRPTGTYNGLTLGLVQEHGTDAFIEAVAAVLRGSASAIEHMVLAAIPDYDDVKLTGAEAVALALHRCGTRVAFAYAGTSELALCDALARVGLLVNGRGDRESLFQAGGASRLQAGTGAAILHGARGLTNALGALADLRRNEMGTLAVVGMPSTGSQPFLPPHGEPDLIAASGDFAKSWFELGAVPKDDPRGYVEEFGTKLLQAIDDVRQAPHGPVLFALPQDVAEAEWLPLTALPLIPVAEQPAFDEGALNRAAELLAVARRPAVLIDDYALTHRGVQAALAAFCARTGAPVLQVKYRRGPMLFERLHTADVPEFIGWYDPKSPMHRAVLDTTDLLITLEDRNMYPRVVGPLPDCPKIAVNTKPAAVEKNGYLEAGDVLVAGDVVAALRELTDEAPDLDGSWYTGLSDEPAPAGETPPAEAAVIRTGVARAIGAAAARSRRRAVLVDDSQMFGGMLAEDYDQFPHGLRVFGGHGGFVGCGITIATGLALGEPAAKVFCTLGDQGFTNSVQGLAAAVQESAPVTFIVCNNGGAVSLRKQSRPSGWLDAGHGQYLDNAAGMRYVDIAEAWGVRSWRVDLGEWLDRDRSATRLETFAQALQVAAEETGPTLIELVLPSDPEFWAGVWITEGFEQQKKAAPEEVARA